jgi:HlyD family secretion protein
MPHEDRTRKDTRRPRSVARRVFALLVLAVLAMAWGWFDGPSQSVRHGSAKPPRGDFTVTVGATGTLGARSSLDIGVEVSGQVFGISIKPRGLDGQN